MPLIKLLGSLKFAITLIASLAILLAVSTWMESVYGTPFAQKIFYNAGWFDIFLSFLWVNIFCSTLTRIPFKKHHTGFVVTHIGILALLTGSSISRPEAFEGQMTLFEGEQKNAMLQTGHVLSITSEAGDKELVPIGKKSAEEVRLEKSGLDVKIAEVAENVKEHRFMREGGEKDASNHAVNATLSSQNMGFSETFTLIEKDPDNTEAYFKHLGPAHLELKTANTGTIPTLWLKVHAGDPILINIDNAQKHEVPVGKTGLKISRLKYFPNAKIENKKIVNSPTDVLSNPAVEFEVTDGKQTEHHTKFLVFPEYPSVRGGGANNFFHLSAILEAAAEEEAHTEGASFFFIPAADGGWKYKIISKGGIQEGDLKIREKVGTGWTDITIEAHQFFERAKIVKTVAKAEAENEGGLAVRVAVPNLEKIAWVTESSPLKVGSPKGIVEFSLDPPAKELPFALELKDFRKIDYPGTPNPASFESDVVLADPEQKITIKKTISMNKPLDHKGFRIFQSSYIQSEMGEASVFTIAKNPGIGLIYGGAAVILVGVLLLFYLHPFFTGRPLRMALILFVTCAAFSPAAGAAEISLETARTIPIQHNGRIKPLDAFARQTVKLLSGGENWQKKPALRVLFQGLANRAAFSEMEWIRIDYLALKNDLQLSEEKHFFSLAEILPSTSRIETLVRSAKSKRDRDVRPSKLEQKAEQLYTKVHVVQGLESGELLTVLPAPDGHWLSPFSSESEMAGRFRKMTQDYQKGAGREFESGVAQWLDGVYTDTAVSRSKLALELFYLKVKPFECAAIAYFLAFLFLSVLVSVRGLFRTGYMLVFIGILFHTFGIVARVAILERPPVSNMYESMIFMNWALMAWALVFYWIKKSVSVLSVASLISGLVMVYGNLLPIDAGLEVLVPVLRSNYWLSIHVMTVVASYGAFGLAMGLGHRHLLLSTGGKWGPQMEEESANLIFRVIQWGVLLIGIGTFLGGVWANESWGRFWGWDPKETWAFITFLGYLIVVHLKYAKKITHFYMAVAAVLGFLLVLMTWYGVNFVLGRGLHSYGAGSGGMNWVVYYLIFEALFIVTILIKKARQNG